MVLGEFRPVRCGALELSWPSRGSVVVVTVACCVYLQFGAFWRETAASKVGSTRALDSRNPSNPHRVSVLIDKQFQLQTMRPRAAQSIPLLYWHDISWKLVID